MAGNVQSLIQSGQTPPGQGACDVGQGVAQLTEAILERDQPRTTDLFFQMVRFPEDVGKGLVANAEALKPTEGEDLVALVTGGSAEACGTG